MPLLPGPPPVEITLRRSARARRFSLRVSRLDGRVTLSLPPGAREAEAMAFARQQEPWIRRALADLPQTATVGPRTMRWRSRLSTWPRCLTPRRCVKSTASRDCT
jgi:predicted metal-dependent hydrolase